MDYSFDFTPLLILFFILGLAFWGGWELIDWLWLEDVIYSTKPIVPEIELIINNNVVDTVYVYKQP